MRRLNRDRNSFLFVLLLVLTWGFNFGSSSALTAIAAFDSDKTKQAIGYFGGNENELHLDVETEFHKLLQNWED